MQSILYRKLFFGLILLSVNAVYAQSADQQDTLTSLQGDSTEHFFSTTKSSYNCNGTKEHPFKMVSEGAIRRQIRRDLSFLVLNRDQSTSPGGGITTTISTDKTEINYNLAFFNVWDVFKKVESKKAEINPKAKNILSINVDAGYKENIGTIFSNTKVNSKAGLLLKYSDLVSKWTGPKTYPSTCSTFVPVVQTHIDYLSTQAKIQKLQTGANFIKKEIDKNAKAMDVIKAALEAQGDSEAGVSRKIELYKELSKLEQAKAKLLSAQNIQTVYHKDQIKQYNDSLISFELANAKWNKSTVTWWDFQVGWNIETFRIFDDLSAAGKVDKKTKPMFSAGFYLNGIQNWKKSLLFLKGGYRVAQTTNLSSFDTYSLETSNVFENGGTQNKIGNTVSSYKLSEVKKFERFHQSALEGQAIVMFAGNTLGFDLFSDLNFAHNAQTVTSTGVLNAGVGFIFTALTQDKEKSKVNVEVFFKLKDINAQTKLSDKKGTWERYDFGVRLGLPFNKVILGD